MQAANASLEQVNEKRWQFDVLLDDKPIGVHTFAVEDTGTQLRLETTASFDVKFLFITAFRYRHQNTEVWQDGCLSSIDAVTDSNGKELVVRGQPRWRRFRHIRNRWDEDAARLCTNFCLLEPGGARV